MKTTFTNYSNEFKFFNEPKKEYDKLPLNEKKSKVENNGTSSGIKLLNCEYTYQNNNDKKLSVTLNTTDKKIDSVYYNGIQVTSLNGIDYKFITDDGKTCKKNTIHIICDSSGGNETCSISTQSSGSISSPLTNYVAPSYSEEDENFYKPLGGGDYVCNGLMSAALRDELVKIYKTVTLIMVVAVIIFGMMDFLKAVSAGDANTMKKVTKTFTNRIIIVILIATLPILLDILLTLFGNESMKNCLNDF